MKETCCLPGLLGEVNVRTQLCTCGHYSTKSLPAVAAMRVIGRTAYREAGLYTKAAIRHDVGALAKSTSVDTVYHLKNTSEFVHKKTVTGHQTHARTMLGD